MADDATISDLTDLSTSVATADTMVVVDATDTTTKKVSLANVKTLMSASPTLVTPALGTPASGTLTNCTGLPTAGLVDDAVTPPKAGDLAKLVNRQDSTSNSVVTDQLVQFGWGWIDGDGASRYMTEAVTFPIEYDAAPVVICNIVGGLSGTVDSIDDLATALSMFGGAYAISTTGFNAILGRVSTDGGATNVLASGADYGYGWVAIGTKAR